MTVNGVFPLIYQISRLFFPRGRLAFQIILTFICFAQQHIAGFVTGFGREQDAESNADSETQKEISQSISIHIINSSF